MAIFGALNGILNLATSQWTKGADTAIKDVDRIDKRTKGFFKDLKSSFGKSSLLGQSLKLAAGGGAIAGLTMGLSKLDEFVQKINELKNAYKANQIGAEEMADHMSALSPAHLYRDLGHVTAAVKDMGGEIAREIPILGGMVKVFDDIRESITGEKAAMDAQNKATQEWIASMDAAKAKHDEYVKSGKESEKRFAEEARTAQQQAILAGMPDGVAKEVKAAQFETANRLRKLNEDFAKDINEEEINKLQKRIGELNTKFAAGKGTEADSHELMNAKEQLQPLLNNRLEIYKRYQAAFAAVQAQGNANINAANKKASDERAKELDEAKKKWDEFTAHNREKLKEMADSITESTKTPMQHFLDDMKKLDLLLQAGLINKDTFGKAAAKAREDLAGTNSGRDEFKATEAEYARGRHVTREDNGGPIVTLNKTAEQQLAEQRKLYKLTEQQKKDVATGRIQVNF